MVNTTGRYSDIKVDVKIVRRCGAVQYMHCQWHAWHSLATWRGPGRLKNMRMDTGPLQSTRIYDGTGNVVVQVDVTVTCAGLNKVT